MKSLFGGTKLRYIKGVVLLLCFSMVLVSLAGCAAPLEKDFPLDLREILPKNWQLQRLEKINIDGDEGSEWLLLYRYTSMPGQPWGGVIYDTQVDISPGRPWIAIPYRPAFLVPYKLLPDLAPGKGQGYLGEKDCDFTLYDTDKNGKGGELAIWGYTYGKECSTPTQLALFRWENKETGYRLTGYFYGDGGIETEPAQGKGTKIEKVTVRTGLHDRNEFCLKSVYQRKEDGSYELVEGPALAFLSEEIPKQPPYPEAAVLAYHLSLRKGEGVETYLTSEGEVSAKDFGLESLKKGVITAIDYPGTPSSSFAIKEETGSVEIKNTAYIMTTLHMEDAVWEVTWRVINISSGKINEDVFWKVDGVISTRRLQ